MGPFEAASDDQLVDFSGEEPSRLGPSHCGQSPAVAAVAIRSRPSEAIRCLKISFVS